MNRYETWISNIARSVITTATQTSEALVSVAMAMIAVVSAVPEFMGLWSASGSMAMGLAIAATGAGSAHGAARSRKGAAISVFIAHIIVAEVILWGHGAYAEMAYPLVTAIGAAVMALSIEHHKDAEAQSLAEALQAEADERERVRAEAEEADRREREREESAQRFILELETRRENEAHRREMERIDAEAKADAKRAKANNKTVQGSVQRTVLDSASTPSKDELKTVQQDSIKTHLLDSGWTGASALARATGLPRSTVYNRLNELSERGQVRNKDGKWDVVRGIAPTLPEPAQIHLNGNGVTHDQP